ncbi:hypothetical protein MRX96_029785 [Rhipicephalus microplus]
MIMSIMSRNLLGRNSQSIIELIYSNLEANLAAEAAKLRHRYHRAGKQNWARLESLAVQCAYLWQKCHSGHNEL